MDIKMYEYKVDGERIPDGISDEDANEALASFIGLYGYLIHRRLMHPGNGIYRMSSEPIWAIYTDEFRRVGAITITRTDEGVLIDGHDFVGEIGKMPWHHWFMSPTGSGVCIVHYGYPRNLPVPYIYEIPLLEGEAEWFEGEPKVYLAGTVNKEQKIQLLPEGREYAWTEDRWSMHPGYRRMTDEELEIGLQGTSESRWEEYVADIKRGDRKYEQPWD